MNGKSISDMVVGDMASFAKTISEHDVYAFAGITGDFNPVHVNREYAEQTIFKGRIAHGALAAGLISGVLGTQLPGPGAIFVSMSMRFLRPVYFGDTITAEVEVAEIIADRNRVRLHTRCRNQHGTIVTDGEAVLMPRKKEEPPLQ